ncbi:hypothetical protein MPSEU_000118000 [Mayamaea pseudoterrestris]|nr:hypothetical protein MPSEU_000118000 [Mayamaea pseudoterrestris]
MDKYDPNAIIQAANQKLANDADIDGGSMVFQSALLEWSDDAREGHHSETLTEAIATLWIAYAQFYANHKQFKTATEIYEQAVSDPVAKHVGRVWLEYARFLEERAKIKSAQNVYIRVLIQDSQLIDEQDQGLLWNEFLEMMQKSNAELTLRELKAAVESERALRPETVASDEVEQQDAHRPAKRFRADSFSVPGVFSHEQHQWQDSKTYVVMPEAVAQESNTFAEVIQQGTLPPDVAAGWMIRDGSGPAHRPDPSLFQPSPPKLADPTAKDILGAMLALKLVEILLGPLGSVLLNVCQGLWTLQALKETEAKTAIATLDETMTREHDRLEATLDDRLAVAGVAASAVQQMNESERQAFQSTCMQQRQNVMTGIAWEFRQLLCLQQQVLSKLEVPGFEGGPTVDTSALKLQAKVCSYLHSAFFLRNRIGEVPHVGMLRKQVSRLRDDVQQHGVHAAASPMGQPSPTPDFAVPGQPGGVYNAPASYMVQPQQVQYQQLPQQMMQMQNGMHQPLSGTYPQQLHGQASMIASQQLQQQQQYYHQ